MLSGVMRGTVLSISVFSVACGIAFPALDIVEADPASGEPRHLAEVALVLAAFVILASILAHGPAETVAARASSPMRSRSPAVAED